MKVTLDASGRLVIPKRIRDEVGIGPNMELELQVRGDVVEMRPVTRAVRLERRGGLVVAVPIEDGAVLRQSEVDETRALLRGQGGAGQ